MLKKKRGTPLQRGLLVKSITMGHQALALALALSLALTPTLTLTYLQAQDVPLLP